MENFKWIKICLYLEKRIGTINDIYVDYKYVRYYFVASWSSRGEYNLKMFMFITKGRFLDGSV